MISTFRLLFVVTLILQALDFTKAGDSKCEDMVMGVMSSQLGQIVPCIKENGYTTSKERAAGYNCIMKCILAKAGTLSPEGRISIMKAITFIMESFPNEYIDKALMEVSKCQQYADIDVGDPNDKNCVKMRPLIQCGVDFVFNICM